MDGERVHAGPVRPSGQGWVAELSKYAVISVILSIFQRRTAQNASGDPSHDLPVISPRASIADSTSVRTASGVKPWSMAQRGALDSLQSVVDGPGLPGVGQNGTVTDGLAEGSPERPPPTAPGPGRFLAGENQFKGQIEGSAPGAGPFDEESRWRWDRHRRLA